MRIQWLGLLLLMAGCPDVKTDNNDGAVPIVEFDPANSIVPFPNNLVLNPMTGKVNLPIQNCETPAQTQVRTQVLNTLDGFGTFEVGIQFTLSEPADPQTLTASNIILYKRAAAGTPLSSPGQAVPIMAFPAKTLRFADPTVDPTACMNPATIDAVTVVPLVPLDGKSTYTLAVLDGVKPAAGGNFYASFVWGLVRQSADPVQFDAMGNVTLNRTPIPEPSASDPSDPNYAQLAGVDQLWQAHATALAFLDATGALSTNRANVLVATDFNTQTTTDPLDPGTTGSPAATLATGALFGTASVPAARGAPCDPTNGCQTFMSVGLGLPCGSLPCNAVGDIFGSGLIQGASMYQVQTPNAFLPSMPIPGPWTDPYAPVSQGPWQKTGSAPAGVLEVLAFIPNANVVSGGVTPPNGWPTVVFGHGLGSSKESLFAIASQLAKAGFASVAIDFQSHGSRAVPVTNDAAQGCAGTCYQGATNTGTPCDIITPCATAGQTCRNVLMASLAPTESPQCYAPFLSPNLATTRDNIRQTVLDIHRLTNAAKACGAAACTSANNGSVLSIDPNHIVYMGISLGGIIGSTVNAGGNFQAGVLNVSGSGWFDILENTANLTIRCGLVDALIDAGVLMGTKPPATDALCLTDAWKQQPGYIQFSSIGRWVLDPADNVNFILPHGQFAGLASKRFLLQEVIDDQVVPNVATMTEGTLAGLTAETADGYNPLTTNMASAAIVTPTPARNEWVQYPTLPAGDATTGGFGNAFEHASLLRPAAVGPGHCVGDPATACGQDSDCAALGNVCIFPGVLGTARVQLDAITYLFANK
jgi:pimeloyl-ACP methyl ester carboxylesterase